MPWFILKKTALHPVSRSTYVQSLRRCIQYEDRTFRHRRDHHHLGGHPYHLRPKESPQARNCYRQTVKNLREGLGGGKKKKEAEEAAKQAEGKEPEELEVVDKPEPGQKKADVAAAEAEAEQDTTTSDAVFEESELEKDKAE